MIDTACKATDPLVFVIILQTHIKIHWDGFGQTAKNIDMRFLRVMLLKLNEEAYKCVLFSHVVNQEL